MIIYELFKNLIIAYENIVGSQLDELDQGPVTSDPWAPDCEGLRFDWSEG